MKRHLFLTITLVMFFSLAVNAFAATYYVKPNGNNTLDGRSDAKAWKTIGKVNSYSFATGDDVYFKCGGIWTGTQLRVSWSGNADNRSIVGAYYVNEGSDAHGVRGNKPIINGNDIIPSVQNEGLISVTNRKYITIENFKVINSEGQGVVVNYGFNNNIINVETDNIYNAGIRYYQVNTGIIEGCDIYNTGRKKIESPGTDYPASIAANSSSHNIIIRKNTVHENYGEGIGLYHYSYDCIIEDNTIYANKAQIYVDRGRGMLIRWNLCRGVGDRIGDGIGINDESQWKDAWSQNNKVYGNLVANCHRGIFIGTNPADAIMKDTFIYNNTIVDCKYNFYNNNGPYKNSEIKNNISWCISGDCRHANIPSDHVGLTFDYNLWSSTPSTGAKGRHDPPYATPKLSKTTGWRSTKGGDLKGSDFALQSTSPAINKGTPLGTEFAYITECDESVWPKQIVLMNQANQGSGWEIGAEIHVVNSTPTVLDSPTNLKIMAEQ